MFCDPVFRGAYFEDAYKKKELPHFFKASAILALAAVVGVCINISNLYYTYEYSKETMRGKSELKQEGAAASQTSSGLDRDYITNWSYGIGETLNVTGSECKRRRIRIYDVTKRSCYGKGQSNV